MKSPLIFIGFVLGILVVLGCSVGLSASSEADEVNKVEAVEQTDNLNQADEVSETASETVSTVEQTEGAAQVDDAEQANEAEVVEETTNETMSTDGTTEVEQIEQGGDAEQTNEVEVVEEAANEPAPTDETTEVEQIEQVEEGAQVDDVEQANEVDEATEASQTDETTEVETLTQTEEVNESNAADMGLANVISVEATGDPGSYTFVVGISSPDEGCQQYADWWEVLNEDGELIYRRVLLHSHVDEQPFVRSGGPVEIAANQTVWVRVHMNTSGYGVVAFIGSVESGFQEAKLSPEFAIEAADLPPLPDGCAF